MCNEREDKGKISKSYNEKLNRKQRDERNHPHGYGTSTKNPTKPRVVSPRNPYQPTTTAGSYGTVTVTTGTLKNYMSPELTLKMESFNIVVEAIELLVKKHKDYGPTNISHAPGGPLNGLNVRLHDKVARLGNLLASGKSPQNESIRDTFIDILNYSVIALLVIDNKWETK